MARIQAPRGTFDVLGDDALARDSLLATARSILERAGYERIETPTFEATELFARGVGASTDIVQKEMYTFADGGGRSLTKRPFRDVREGKSLLLPANSQGKASLCPSCAFRRQSRVVDLAQLATQIADLVA